jgi:hypothetical protein
MAPLTRRSFLKQTTLGGLGLALGLQGCSPYPKNVNWKDVPDSEFSIQKFDEWFDWHKLYNGMNPHLQSHQVGNYPTFKISIGAGFSPGIDYNSNYLYAAADGVVVSVHAMDTGRAGGTAIWLAHSGGDNAMGIETRYVHLGKSLVQGGQKVKRGDRLADVELKGSGKLMLIFFENLVDPDNYGDGHSHMKYFDGVQNPPVESPRIKRYKQREICEELFSHTQNMKLSFEKFGRNPHFSEINHPKRGTRFAHWDYIELFRYTEELYKAKPTYFPRLSPDKFAEYKKDFYANQPIILTLPLKA